MKYNNVIPKKQHMVRVVLLPLLAALLVQVNPAGAQESIFGLQFLGTSEETSDARARALGVLGIGLDERRSAITQNPATLALLDYMTISAMFVSGSRKSSSATDEETFAVARFPHARFALPMFGRFVVSAGFSGFRNFKGKINLPEAEIDGLAYRYDFVRDGTILHVSDWRIGLPHQAPACWCQHGFCAGDSRRELGNP